MAQILGTPLPPEAAVRTTYTGTPRIFVTNNCTRWKDGEPFEIRPFILSPEACNGVSLYWRPLGKGSFSKVQAAFDERQAYRVTLPASPEDCVEYYLEASLAGGKKIRYPVTAPEINSTVVFWED